MFPLFPDMENPVARERVSVRVSVRERAHVEIVSSSGNSGNKGTENEYDLIPAESVFPVCSQSSETLGTETARPLAEREVLETAVAHVAFLAPTSLVLAVPGVKGYVVWTSSRERHGEALRGGEPVYSPLEIEMLAFAFQQGRYLPGDLEAFSVRKLREPGWRLTELVACHGLVPRVEIREPWRPCWYLGDERLGVHPHHQPHGVTLGRLLVAHRARLEGVELEGERRAA